MYKIIMLTKDYYNDFFEFVLACYSNKGRTGYNPIMLYAVYFKGRKLKGEALDELKYGRCEKVIMETGWESEMRWLPAYKIRRFMVGWRCENERESRWED
jgi:hypothetical protein